MDTMTTKSRPSSCFKCTRLNPSTFVIVEADKYDEHPFIYARIFLDPLLLILSDTGCGGKSDGSTDIPDNLRNYVETRPITSNGNLPLNPRQPDGSPSLRYLIICTHCHYDHILGIPSFQDIPTTILASLHGKSFIETDLARHSLCYYLDVPTPEYKVSYWADDFEYVRHDGNLLGLQILHTPGHTPDELAWYDEENRHIFVGDSFYERVAEDQSYIQPIIFPREGNMIDYMQTLEKLVRFVEQRNAESDQLPVKVGCGHITSSVDGFEILVSVQQYFQDVLGGKIPVVRSIEKGEIFDLWQADGEPRFSLLSPRRLVLDARRHLHIGPLSDASFVIA
ncbi:MAG: hypothetical protein Q9187_001650 [Circinaria calcarea]